MASIRVPWQRPSTAASNAMPLTTATPDGMVVTDASTMVAKKAASAVSATTGVRGESTHRPTFTFATACRARATPSVSTFALTPSAQ